VNCCTASWGFAGLVLVPAVVIPLVVIPLVVIAGTALVVVIALVVVVIALVVVTTTRLRVARRMAVAIRATTVASLLLTGLPDLPGVLRVSLSAVIAAVGMGRRTAALRQCGARKGQKSSRDEYKEPEH
jgi:hypothetical protein